MSLLCVSSLARRVPDPVACWTDPRSFVVRKGELLDGDLGVNQTWNIDYPKRFPAIPMYSMCQVAFVAAQHGTRSWNHCRVTGNVRQSPIPLREILPNHSWIYLLLHLLPLGSELLYYLVVFS